MTCTAVSCTLQMNVHLVLHRSRNFGQDEVASISRDCRITLRGVAMGLSQVGLPTRTKVDPAIRRPLDLTAKLSSAPGRPRVVRMPSDWWDSPAVAACTLSAGAQSGRTARKFTRNTLKDWGLASLADDAEAIVGEFVANAVSHAFGCCAGPVRSCALCSTPPIPRRCSGCQTGTKRPAAACRWWTRSAMSGAGARSLAAVRPSGPSCSALYVSG